MKCPVCKDVTLLMTEKHGVEIDYCPECRGIWLDRGELDKIVDRARGAQEGYYEEPRERTRDGLGQRHNHDGQHVTAKRKKKESPLSALSDLMEIFGGE
ncbi:hypothetical protein B5G20_07305 [Collinsella sp. An7]|uniref:TFIIB-type zinc ribbon-containing protein n=1 Tax=Collinsella sp. An7 TaxID=1965651 RepID=UPI000B3AB816|nr:zf-TFIIB domain-containing protein [Collinsella sp. An7]OUN46750.1 hypothetical protein B5G20_07305 [Collinsella sp. An7]